MFDEQSFLNSQTQSATSTKRIPIPVGTYDAVISDVKVRANVAGKKDPTKSYNFLDYVLDLVLTPEAQAVMETTEATIRRNYSIIVELNESGTGLASGKGKNISLGKFREALNQNEDGKPWSPRTPVGKMVKAIIVHQNDEAGDPRDQIEMVAAK